MTFEESMRKLEELSEKISDDDDTRSGNSVL